MKKKSIRARILTTTLSLISGVFLVVLLVFNVLVRQYIEKHVGDQLRGIMQVVNTQRQIQRPPVGEAPPVEPKPGPVPDMRRIPGRLVGRVETMIISGDYELIFPEPGMIFLQGYDQINALVEQIKNEEIDLESAEIRRVEASGRQYYLVSVSIPAVSGDNEYLIYYIDMTAMTSFADRINAVLLAAMGVTGVLAGVTATFLSGKITEPINELKEFAVRIGKGDFTPNEVNYKDAELFELAESMNKAALQLDAYDKEQKTFFQNASHEFRTPLQIIKSNAEGIEHGILDSKQASKVIVNEADRLGELVDDLLYLSRISTTGVRTEFEECDLRELLSSCSERYRALAAERGLEFVFDFDDDPVNMSCDQKGISRAFSNLISNAIRYATKEIVLSCHQRNGEIVVAVADDGPGISEEDLPHIYDRFYKGRGGDHGIGLSIVKSVVNQHGGTIEASNSDKGAVFTLTFSG